MRRLTRWWRCRRRRFAVQADGRRRPNFVVDFCRERRHGGDGDNLWRFRIAFNCSHKLSRIGGLDRLRTQDPSYHNTV